MKLALALVLGAVASSKVGTSIPSNALTINGEPVTINGEVLTIT